ncbi:MAG: XRE family transcriptional regulator [Stigonema ocellatum SAG 48.90 = DSM 106950]|nr:XRE family transcriptional regulator [Stigonema ocellatum SAG 48.90 = DSM 106950]
MAQVHQLFKQAMDRYDVKGKDLAAIAGITPNHLSDFRSGKKWVGPEVFVALLEGMDKLSPGSRQYFCQLLAGEKTTQAEHHIVSLIENASDDEMEMVILAFGRRWKKSCQQTPASISSQLDSAIA